MEVAALGLRVDGTQNIDKATASLNDFSKAGSNAEKSTAGVAAGSQKAKLGVRELSASADNATGSLRDLASIGARVGGVLGAAFSISAIKNYADQWSDLQSRVGAATKDMAGAAKQMSRLVDIANASYSSLDQTVSAYAGNVGALQDLGKSAADAADYTESLNHMLVLTATRGERAASVQNALSKAMAVGKLEADGLETVLANGGEVAAALAKELGTTVSGLRALASDGKITGAVIADAIIKPLDEVRERAAEMPATIGDAFTRITTNTTELVGVFDKLTGASEAVASGVISAADSMRNLSQNAEVLENIAKAGEVLAVVIGSRLVASTVASAAAFAAKAVQAGVATVVLKAYEGQSLKTAAANTALTASARTASGAMALLGGPAGLIVTSLGLAALAWSNYGDSARDNAGEGVLGLVDTKKELVDLVNEFEKLNKIQQQQTIDIKTQDMASAAKDASKAFFDLGSAFAPAMDQGTRAAAQFRADFNADIKDVADNTDLSADQMADALVRVIDEYINSGRATEASRKKMLEYAQALATAKGEVNGLRGELAALSNVQGVYTEGMGNSPVVQKQNEALERTVKAAIDATKSFKSTAERVNEVRESSNQAAAALKVLEASGRGASDEANILRGRIEGANKEIEKLQKGSSGASSSKKKLKDASKELEAQIKREQAAYAQLVEMQQEAADYYVQLSKNQENLGRALDQATRSIQEQSELLDLEERMIGKSNAERQHAIELLQIERDLRKEIDEIDRMDLPGGEASREEARVRARANAAKKIANAERKVYIDSWREINQYVENSLYDAIVTGGASAKEALQRMFQNLVLRPIVQAAVGGLFGGASGSASNGGVGGALSGAQNLQSLYSAFSGGLVSTVGGAIGKLGATFGSSALTSFAAGMKGSTIAAGLAGPTTAGASGFMGAGAMAASALPWVAGAAAVLSLASGMLGGGTPHGGAAAGYSGGQITDFGKGFTRKQINSDYTSGMQAGVSAVAATVGQSFDALAAVLGKQGGYRVTTGFSADSDDPAWGRLQIYDAVGSALVDWNAGRYGPKDTRLKSQFSSDPEKAFDQYLQSVAASSLPALKDIAPAWADAMIDGVTQAIGFDGSSWKSITVSGQEAVSAMQSVVQQIALVEAGFASLGNAMSMFSGMSDDMKTSLLGALGGIEGVTQAAGIYYNAFYSEQERYEASLKQMRATLASIGASLDPAAEDAKYAFRSAVEEAMNAGKGELSAQLLALGSSFSQLADAAAKAAQAQREAVIAAQLQIAQVSYDTGLANLTAAVNREKQYWSKIQDASQKAINTLSSSLGLLTNNANELYGQISAAQQMQSAAGMVYIENALSAAKRGTSVANFTGLDDAISAARRGINEGNYASRFEQERDAQTLANQLSALAELTDGQLSLEERQLKAATTQIDQLDKTLGYWQNAMSLGGAQISATMSVHQAVMALGPLLESLRGATAASYSQSIKEVTPKSESEKAALYLQMLGSGLTDAQIRAQVEKTTGAQSQTDWDYLRRIAGVDGSHASGLARVPFDGYIAELHKDEAVIPAAYNPFAGGKSKSGSSTDDLLRQLIADNRAQAGEIIRLNMKLTKIIEQWDGEGLPHEREEYEV